MFKKIMLVILVALPLLLPGPNLWADDDYMMDVDDNAASFSGTWQRSTYRILYYGDDYQYAVGSGGAPNAAATFTTAQTADITGKYAVYVRWTAGTARATNARYNIYDDTNAYKGQCTYDQRSNGGAWMFCAEVTLNAGRRGRVIINNANVPTDRYVCADAVRFVRVSVKNAGADAAFYYGCQGLEPTDEVVRAVTLSVPSAGRVIVNASGYFYFASSTARDGARCSITMGTSVEVNSANVMYSYERAADSLYYEPFAMTRGFSVSTPGSYTYRLVCDEYAGDPRYCNPHLTAIFVPGSF